MLLDRLDEAHRFEAPPSLVEEEFNLMWNSIKAEMDSGGKTADENTTGGGGGGVPEDRRPPVRRLVPRRSAKNKITVSTRNAAVIERARRCRAARRKSGLLPQQRQCARPACAPIYEDKVVDFRLNSPT
jgi:trigger factor